MVVVGSRDWGGSEGLLCYSTGGATVHAGTVHSSATAAARVVGALGMPAAGLCPWPAREKGFPSNPSLD